MEKLKQENRLLKKIFKDQGLIVNQWLSDKAPEGAVQERGGNVLQSGLQRRSRIGEDVLMNDSDSD